MGGLKIIDGWILPRGPDLTGLGYGLVLRGRKGEGWHDGKGIWTFSYYLGCSIWGQERILGQTCVYCDFFATPSHTVRLLVQQRVSLPHRDDALSKDPSLPKPWIFPAHSGPCYNAVVSARYRKSYQSATNRHYLTPSLLSLDHPNAEPDPGQGPHTIGPSKLPALESSSWPQLPQSLASTFPTNPDG